VASWDFFTIKPLNAQIFMTSCLKKPLKKGLGLSSILDDADFRLMLKEGRAVSI
jgi:hypothetical protein